MFSRRFAPTAKGEVDLVAVQNCVLEQARKFKCRSVRYDPYQAKLMAQMLQNKGVRMEEVIFSGRNLHDMASAVLEIFRERKLDLYRDKHLINDLLKLEIVEKSYGYRLEAVRDDQGHADVATAFAIALPEAVRLLKMSLAIPRIEMLKKFEPDPELARRLDKMVEENLKVFGLMAGR